MQHLNNESLVQLNGGSDNPLTFLEFCNHFFAGTLSFVHLACGIPLGIDLGIGIAASCNQIVMD